MDRQVQRTVLEAFRRTLGQELHNIRDRPDILWQQMYNRLQWADGLEKDGAVTRIVSFELERRSKQDSKPWLRLKTVLFENSLLLTIKGHQGRVNSCAFSPDGKWIVSASEDQTLKLWDATTGTEVKTFHRHRRGVNCCAFSCDGQLLVSGSKDETLKLWDSKTCEELAILEGHHDSVSSCVFGPDGKTILSSGDDGTIRLWDLRTHQEVPAVEIDGITSCALSPDGQFIITTSGDGTLTLLDAESFEELSRTSEMKSLSCCAFSPCEEMIVAAGESSRSGDEARLFHIEDGELAYDGAFEGSLDTERHWKEITTCVFSPDGSMVVTGGADKYLLFWDAESREFITRLAGHSSAISSCAFSPNGRSLVSSSHDGTLNVWDVEAARNEPAYEDVFSDSISCCAFSPDGSKAVAGSLGGHLVIYDRVSNEVEASPAMQADTPITSCAFSPDGRTVAVGTVDSKLLLFDADHHKRIACRTEAFSLSEDAAINACAFSPEGKNIVTASGTDPDTGDGSVILWGLEDHRKPEFLARSGAFSSCAFSPDGRKLIWGGEEITCWDLEIKEKIKEIRIPNNRVTCCAFSCDGRMIVSAYMDGTIKLWDAKSYEELDTFHWGIGRNPSCGLSPDGRFMVLASSAGILDIRFLKSGARIASFPSIGPLTCCDFNSTGQEVCCGDKGGHFYLFSLMGLDFGPLDQERDAIPREVVAKETPYLASSPEPLPAKLTHGRIWRTNLAASALALLCAGGAIGLTLLSPWLWLLAGPLILFAPVFIWAVLRIRVYPCPHCSKPIRLPSTPAPGGKCTCPACQGVIVL